MGEPKITDTIISLNLTDGEVLTLEKAVDRMEFEALPVMGLNRCFIDDCCKGGTAYTDCTCVGGGYETCGAKIDQCLVKASGCPLNGIGNPCGCDGPVGYINCHPFTTCPSNHCRPVSQ